MTPDHAHCLDLIRSAYELGVADACVWQAELHADEVADRYWQDWWTGMNQDRRDTRLHERLRALLADGKRLGWYDRLTLHLADHPEVRFQHDPDMRPHGRAA